MIIFEQVMMKNYGRTDRTKWFEPKNESVSNHALLRERERERKLNARKSDTAGLYNVQGYLNPTLFCVVSGTCVSGR